MSFKKMLTTPVTIVRAAVVTDRYGAESADWTNARRTSTVGWLNDVSSSEVVDGRDALISGWKLYLPADADVTGFDRVEIDGVTYEVNGPPSKAQTPKRVHHIECRLLLVEG